MCLGIGPWLGRVSGDLAMSVQEVRKKLGAGQAGWLLSAMMAVATIGCGPGGTATAGGEDDATASGGAVDSATAEVREGLGRKSSPGTVQSKGDSGDYGDSRDCKDHDYDKVCDEKDNCPYDENYGQKDSDYDGHGDACDNCPYDKNPDQKDSDHDGKGDACDKKKEVDGRMTGGGSIIDKYVGRVTHGFQVRCDENDPRQNLQVNWGRGERFHLTDLTSAFCFNARGIEESPPEAGFDTFLGEGEGRYNGEDGATIRFKFTDAGEPGRRDFARIVIRDASGDVVLEVEGKLTFGNHQAHRVTGGGPD